MRWFTGLVLGIAIAIGGCRIFGLSGTTDRLAAVTAKRIMNAITFRVTINGVERTRTYTREDGETDEQFELRAEAAWAAYLERIGGQ